MTYVKSYTAWQDFTNTSTPITAAKLQNMDDGVYVSSASVNSLSSSTVALSASTVALSASTVALTAAVIALSGASSASATDATLSFTDVTTNDSSTAKHGFLKKLSGVATQYMNGTGAFSVPAVTGGTSLPTVVLTSSDVDITGVTGAAATINAALASVDPNRGGNVYLPNGKLRIETPIVMNIQGQALIGVEGQPGIDDSLAKGTTQLIVDDGIWGATIGSSASTDWRGYRMENLQFYEKNAGKATGMVRALRVCTSVFERCSFGRSTTATSGAFYLDGTGDNAQYNTFIECRFGQAPIAYQQKAANGTVFLGGYFEGSNALAGVPVAGSIGMKLTSGDTARVYGTRIQGYDTLVEVGPNLGHEFYGLRCEVWTTVAVRALSSARSTKVFGYGDNSLRGSLGAGVIVDAGAQDTWDGMSILSVSSTANRHVDNGTRTRNLWHEDVAFKAGAVSDTDFDDPRNGMTGIDITNNRFYVRVGGVWKYTALT